MKIHLILPCKRGRQTIFTGNILAEEGWISTLLSYAYAGVEPDVAVYWEKLIDHVQSSRNS